MGEELELSSVQDIEAEIEKLANEIEDIKARLVEVQEEIKTEEEFEDAQDDIEDDMPIEGEPENREPTKLDELKQEEKELNTELVSKQMKMVALQKRLNDLNSNNAMEDMIKGE